MGLLKINGNIDINNKLSSTSNLLLNSNSYISLSPNNSDNFRFSIEDSSGRTSAAPITALTIVGGTYGNDTNYIKTAGQLSYGDPGPQIIFRYGFSGTQNAALIYTDNDSIAAGNSLSLVSDQTNCSFIAPTIKALTKFIGTLDGNSSTATKLKTARTISLTGSVTGSGTFDGSGNLSITTTTNHTHDSRYVNIDGDTMSGSLTVNAEIISVLNGHGQFRMVGGNYGTFFRNDGSHTYILLTNSGDAYGTWNSLRPFYINNSTGSVYINNDLHVSTHLYLTGNLITGGLIQYENGTYTNKNMITFLTGDNNGAGIVIGGGGCVIIGAGESATNFQSAASIGATTETTYITSDTTIQFFTNCQTIANRKNVEIDASAKINAGGKAELWTDSEGGNLRLTSPGGNRWSIDALNNSSLRFIWEEASVPITFSSNGTIVANYLQGTAQYANSATASNSVTSTGFGSGNFTYLQTSGNFYGASNWAHYLIANHGDGASYYNYVIRLPFWSSPQYKYQTGSTSSTYGWYNFHTTENVKVQSNQPTGEFVGQIWLKI